MSVSTRAAFTLIDNSKLANQIARLQAILVQHFSGREWNRRLPREAVTHKILFQAISFSVHCFGVRLRAETFEP